jgi:predicted 3-demethylubiquinone-9 3-methyltransferase (glyoxalase superfamily)
MSFVRGRRLPGMEQKIVTNLWFDTEAQEAAEFYCSVFEDSRIVSVLPYPEAVADKAGQVMVVEWELNGQRFVGINGGPQFKFSEAISLQINCEDQAEVDYYWEKLAVGGKHGMCGWLNDKYGLAWQVTPAGMDELYDPSDPERASRAMEAMMAMSKLDIAALQAAADGE